jgi:CheY-like chemotaxis protein
MEQRHILVVDDNLADFELTMEAALGHAHLRLHHVCDAIDALAWLARQGRYRDAVCPDLILLDLNMPKIDGLSLLQALKRSSWSNIPIIMFTTSARAEDRQAALERGAIAFWSKPDTLDGLLGLMDAVGDWAAGKRSLDHLADLGTRG